MTPVEKELLAECREIARHQSCPVAEIVAASIRWWSGPGRLIHPRQWRSRVAAARRLLARGV